MSFSDYFGFAVACAFGVLAIYLADNEWAKSHYWLVPTLWTAGGGSLLLAVVRFRNSRLVKLPHHQRFERATNQTVAGNDNSATAVGSFGNVGAGATVNIGGHQIVNQTPVTSATNTRPKLTPLRYGRLGLGDEIMWAGYKEALWIQNDGETANDVRVEPLVVGNWIVTFEGPITITTNGRGRMMVESIRKPEQSGGSTTMYLTHAWEDAYTTHGTIGSILLRVSYKDFHGSSFCSECALQRDVLTVGDSPFRVAGCADRPVRRP
jgi:hypothetical protein